MDIKDIFFKLKKYIHPFTLKSDATKNSLYKSSYRKALTDAYKFVFEAKEINIFSTGLKINFKKTLTILVIFIALLLAVFYTFLPRPLIQDRPKEKIVSRQYLEFEPHPVVPNDTSIIVTEEPEELQILELYSIRESIETRMRQINEPVVWGTDLLYSAGDASSIAGPVLTRLFLYDSITKKERELVASQIRFGEIYEGRLNDSWIVWLDTNQTGTNHIYALNRSSGETIPVSRSSLNRPQLALWGDFLIWSGQKEERQDRMYVFNLSTGDLVEIEDFDNPTYGTSSPAIHDGLLVWAYPHPEYPETRSVIKTLDLKTANLFLQTDQNAFQISADEEEKKNVESMIFSEITTIDPEGFAIYPATNGNAIAWLNDINPAQAQLKMTIDKGETIVTVAKGVGRFFGVGEDFLAYTQQGKIMLYFWATNRFAILTKEGEQAKLAELPVMQRTIVWYDATDPNRKQDDVKISVIEPLP